MEVKTVNANQLYKALKLQLELIERVRRFHLSVKPMFFHRDSWNQTNDMLVSLEIQAIDCMSFFTIMVEGNTDGVVQLRRYHLVR